MLIHYSGKILKGIMNTWVIISLPLIAFSAASPNGYNAGGSYSSHILRDAQLDVEETDEPTFTFKGKRIVDIDYFLEQLFARSRHTSLFSCGMFNVPLIREHGYPAEIHTVTTSDGYILEMHRIPHGRRGCYGQCTRRPPVLLIHGILCSSADWVIMGPSDGLGYILADDGYDVWMGNTRGNYYSRKHTKLDPDGLFSKLQYWDFSWHEVGIHDLPTMIDYILTTTQMRALHYIGHSQGTTAFFVMASLIPQYNDKITSMQALSPTAYMQHVNSLLIKTIAPFSTPLQFAASILGLGEFLPTSLMLKWAGQALCLSDSFVKSLCDNLIFLLSGSNASNLNQTTIPVLLGHTPAGASTKQLCHYGQLMNSGEFAQWDYGFIKNMFEYGGMTVPKYNLRNVRAPVTLHYSEHDTFTDYRDVLRLYNELGNSEGMYKVNFPGFSHMDFIWSMQARFAVYDVVLGTMSSYN